VVEEISSVRRLGVLQLTAIAVLALAVIALALGKNVVATVLFVVAAVGFLATIFLQRRR
jgi:multisubunit Na+/H+ antiporter MnhF subunit